MTKTNNKVAEVARAALDYIDAIPAEIAATFPVMPGFDRDWAENVLAGGVPDDVLEQVAPIDRRYMVDMACIKPLPEDEERKEEAINAMRYPALQRITSCRVCGSESLTWDSVLTTSNGVQQGRLTTQDVSVLFYLGCDECSETLAHMSAEDVAARMNIRQKWGK